MRKGRGVVSLLKGIYRELGTDLIPYRVLHDKLEEAGLSPIEATNAITEARREDIVWPCYILREGTGEWGYRLVTNGLRKWREEAVRRLKNVYVRLKEDFITERALIGELAKVGLSEAEARSAISEAEYRRVITFGYGFEGPGYRLLTDEDRKADEEFRRAIIKEMLAEEEWE